MINKSVLALAIILIGCKTNEQQKLVLAKNVQLVAPFLEVSNQLLDSTVTIKASLRIENSVIHYTNDGSVPSKNSLKYSKELEISNPGTYTFRAFHPQLLPSEVIETKIIKKGKSVTKIKWKTTPNNRYIGQGANTVINNTKAKLNFSDKQWVGFDTLAIATVYFDKKTTITSMDIGYLNNPGSWIFPPESVEIEFSEDGSNFQEKNKFDLPINGKNSKLEINSYSIPINKDIKAIKIRVNNISQIPEWHEGKGKKAWLFMDEWIFN